MAELVRFSVSMDAHLVRAFDELCRKKGYACRSEAIRDLIRGGLVEQEWEADEEVAGVITLLYDHHKPGLTEELVHLQHHTPGCVISTTHVHLDEENCLECVAVRGKAHAINGLADRLTSLKGVKHGALTATSTGRHLS